MGIRYGRTVGVGKAGNSDVIPNVHPGIGGGGATSPNSSAGCIVTAGADDCHAHLIWPEQSDHALADGTTTMVESGSRFVFDVSIGGATSFSILQ
jgi:urease subunit alpha